MKVIERAKIAAGLIVAVHARGSDAEDLRDAAHEACHALKWKVRGSWSRERINRSRPLARSYGVADEILARAVEQIVCARLGVDCGSVEDWAAIACLETLKLDGLVLPGGDWFADAVRSRMQSTEARRMANRVVALGRARRRKPL